MAFRPLFGLVQPSFALSKIRLSAAAWCNLCYGIRSNFDRLRTKENRLCMTCVAAPLPQVKKGLCCPWVAPVELTPTSDWKATLASLCSDQHAPGRHRGSPSRDLGRVQQRHLRGNGDLTNWHSLPKVQGTSSE